MARKDVREAQKGAEPIIKKLCELGARCMEQTLDPAGIVWERWNLPNGRSVIVFGTPHWRDAFVSVAPKTDKWDETLAALAAVANQA